MAARDILEEHAASTGWNVDSMLEIVCAYVDNQQSNDAFEDFVRRRAEEELEEV
jgi:hypothetical protein